MLFLTLSFAHAVDVDAVHARLDSDAGWTLHSAANDDGVTVYSKPMPALDLEAFRGVLVLPAGTDVDAIYTLVADLENHDKVSKHLHESTLLAAEGNQDWFYEVSKSPAPLISERYWFNTTVTEKDIDGKVGHYKRRWSTFDAAAKYPDELADVQARYPDAVLVDMTYGSWEWEPQDDGTTVMTYTVVSAPGGSVPSGLYQTVSSKTLPDNMMTFVRPALK